MPKQKAQPLPLKAGDLKKFTPLKPMKDIASHPAASLSNVAVSYVHPAVKSMMKARNSQSPDRKRKSFRNSASSSDLSSSQQLFLSDSVVSQQDNVRCEQCVHAVSSFLFFSPIPRIRMNQWRGNEDPPRRQRRPRVNRSVERMGARVKSVRGRPTNASPTANLTDKHGPRTHLRHLLHSRFPSRRSPQLWR